MGGHRPVLRGSSRLTPEPCPGLLAWEQSLPSQGAPCRRARPRLPGCCSASRGGEYSLTSEVRCRDPTVSGGRTWDLIYQPSPTWRVFRFHGVKMGTSQTGSPAAPVHVRRCPTSGPVRAPPEWPE